MLVNLNVKLENGSLISLGSKEFDDAVRLAAALYPKSVAANLVQWADVPVMGTPLVFNNPAEGFYERGNFDNLLRDVGFRIESWDIKDLDTTDRNSFGVADNLAQVESYYKPFLNTCPEREFVISFFWVHKNPQNCGKGGGWRWHKWGPYIGVQEPTYEYLDDEPLIEKVIVFHLIEILPPKAENKEEDTVHDNPTT